MNDENGVIAAIRRVQSRARFLKEQRGMTRKKLCIEADLSYETLAGYLDEDWMPTTTTLEKVEKALERLSQ